MLPLNIHRKVIACIHLYESSWFQHCVRHVCAIYIRGFCNNSTNALEIITRTRIFYFIHNNNVVCTHIILLGFGKQKCIRVTSFNLSVDCSYCRRIQFGCSEKLFMTVCTICMFAQRKKKW